MMAYERIMGLEIRNDEQYTLYREAMTPILHSFGGSFGYDFKIAEVLKSKTTKKINRVFTIAFPSKKVMDNFFSDPAYLKVKKQYFVNSVNDVTEIAMVGKK